MQQPESGSESAHSVRHSHRLESAASGTFPWQRTAARAGITALLLAAVASAAVGRHYRVLLSTGASGFGVIHAEAWPGPGSRVLVIAPHPDDETLGGEPVLRAAVRDHRPARVIVVTCGDGFRKAAQRAFGVPATPEEMIRLGRLRQTETLHAAHAMGLNSQQVVFLGFPDGGIAHLWAENWLPSHRFRSLTTGVDHCPYQNAAVPGAPYCGQSLLAELESQIREFRPTDIYVSHPWDDHPDHSATNFFVTAALNTLSGFAPHIRLHPYLVHSGSFPSPRGYYPSLFIDPPPWLRSNGLIWSELRLTPGQTMYRRNIIDLYSSQLALTRPFLERFAARSVLFGDAPAFRIRKVHWGPQNARWTLGDAYFTRDSLRTPNAIVREQAALAPRGLMLRIQSTVLARGTLCRIRIHPLMRPPPGHSGHQIASLGAGPVYVGARLTRLTADDRGHVSCSGGARYDKLHIITLLLPRSLFSGAERAYVDVSLIHGGHLVRNARSRELILT